MASLIGTLLFSLIIGFAIFLSLPIVMRKKTSDRTTKLLNAIAIGILVFLMCDIFSNAVPSLYTGSLDGYGANLAMSGLFAVALAIGFFMLYYFENRSVRGMTPALASLMIAVGIGLQNLTEGLVFGALSQTLGLFSGVALVVLVGFVLQNITEGFPIAAPFLGERKPEIGLMLLLFLVGGVPTVVGSVAGFYYSSSTLDIVFYGLALGSILYVMLPMTKNLLTGMDHIMKRVVYAGIFIGFILGFLVNLI